MNRREYYIPSISLPGYDKPYQRSTRILKRRRATLDVAVIIPIQIQQPSCHSINNGLHNSSRNIHVPWPQAEEELPEAWIVIGSILLHRSPQINVFDAGSGQGGCGWHLVGRGGTQHES